ncbi:MAG: GDSL-type esterase/lipase family protein [Lentimicrobium sp.]
MNRLIFTGLKLVIFLLLLVSCSPLSGLDKNPEVSKWENNIRKFESLPVSESSKTILFVGSSSINLWESVAEDMLPYQAIARGYGGAKLTDLVFYIRRIVAPHECGAIVIFVANDITGDSTDRTPEEILSLFKLTIRQIRKSHPQTPVFWIEITPTPARWAYWGKISEASRLIKDFCSKTRNLDYVPTSHKFIGSDGNPVVEFFQKDNLHLNSTGYKLWSDCIKSELDKRVPQLK